MQPTPTLLAVPNVSEGRDPALIEALTEAFAEAGEVRLLDRHVDPDHHRSVFTLAGPARALVEAVLAGATVAVRELDVMTGEPGVHPRVGALDVAPFVYLDSAARGTACAAALLLGERVGSELEVPVFLYGALGAERTRAELRRGGAAGLAERLRDGELRPDFGPGQAHERAGTTLVAARRPLVAFNLELAPPADLEEARRLAALLREGGDEGLAGLRAIGLPLSRRGAVQISMNVEDPFVLPLGAIVREVAARAGVECAEIVGLVPAAALEGFPADVTIRGFDPDLQVIESALGQAPRH